MTGAAQRFAWANADREDLSYMGWTWCIQSYGQIPVEDQALRLRQLRGWMPPPSEGPGATRFALALPATQGRMAELITVPGSGATTGALAPETAWLSQTMDNFKTGEVV
jgi:hypothetical protein